MYRNKGFFPLLVKYRFRQKGWNNIFKDYKMWFKQFHCTLFSVALSVGLTDFLILFFFHMERMSLIWSYLLFKQRERMGKSFIVDTAAGSTISIPKEFQYEI